MTNNIYVQLDEFYKLVDNHIKEGKYQVPKYVENSGHLNFPLILKSVHFKLSALHYFNTQFIKIREQINSTILQKYGQNLDNKNNTTEYQIRLSISPTLAAIYFDSFILHLGSFFDIFSKLIQYFYNEYKSHNFHELQKSCMNDTANYMGRFIQKNWESWIKLIYDHRVLIFHRYYDEPDHIYNIKIDSLNNVKVKYFEVPEQLKKKLPSKALNTDILSFSRELTKLLEIFITTAFQIIKMDKLNINVPIIRFRGEIMTEENSLHLFRNGDVARAEDINKNFNLLLDKIKSLEEKIASLEGKKVIE